MYDLAVRPLGRRAAAAIGVLAFAVVIAGAVMSGSAHGDFRVDEAHKISETAFLRLWLRGDVRNPAWFQSIVDRTNPPIGKYAFGTAIVLAGEELPPLPTLAVHGDFIPPTFSEELSAPYRHLLVAARSASTVATALTAALITILLARYHGWLAATAAFLCFIGPRITRDFWATAVFDPLLAFLFMATIALTAMLAGATSTKRIVFLAAALGVITALTFQTRLNGLFALLIALSILGLTLWRNVRQAIVAIAIVMSAFVATTLLVNPYYWSSPRVPVAPFTEHRGPLRPIERLVQQKTDLQKLATPLREGRTEGRTLGEKFRYLAEGMVYGVTSLIALICAAAGILTLPLRWRSLQPALRLLLAMALAVVIIMTVTLPMPWSRYLLVNVAPLALFGGFAVAEGVRAFVVELRRARS